MSKLAFCTNCGEERETLDVRLDGLPICEECWDKHERPRHLTAGQLLKLLKSVPDDLPVAIRHLGCDSPKPVEGAGVCVDWWDHWRHSSAGAEQRKFFELYFECGWLASVMPLSGKSPANRE